jgi:hypothetical protein
MKLDRADAISIAKAEALALKESAEGEGKQVGAGLNKADENGGGDNEDNDEDDSDNDGNEDEDDGKIFKKCKRWGCYIVKCRCFVGATKENLIRCIFCFLMILNEIIKFTF